MNPIEGPGPASSGRAGSAADLVGSVIAGRYRLLRLLGEGAMGAVYLGEHLKIGRQDAIKVLRGRLAADPEWIARFNRGARNLSAIRHPNVCMLYDYGETEDGSPFLALEYITGGSLKELVDREVRLEPARALSIARQIAAALAAAHDAGIVHRDLKPGNIMLERGRDGSDVVKVVDFDIAKGREPETGDEVTRLDHLVGTPEYMSPEQLTGERLDGRSDVYSLGIVLFRMLTGAPPFRSRETQQIMIERLTQSPLTLAEANPALSLPVGFQHVLDRSLVADRTLRYPDADAFASDLAAVDLTPGAPPEPAESVPETRVEPLPAAVVARRRKGGGAAGGSGGRRSYPAWMLAVAGVVVVSAAVGTWVMTRNGEPEPPDPRQEQEQQNPQPIDSTGPGRGGGEDTIHGRGGGGGTRSDSTNTDTLEPPEPPPPRSRLEPERASEVLLEQNRLVLSDADVEFGLTRDRARARAVRDTAAAVYRMPSVSDSLRGQAAEIAGLASLALRDATECRRWFNLALQMKPGDETVRSQLQLCDLIDR